MLLAAFFGPRLLCLLKTVPLKNLITCCTIQFKQVFCQKECFVTWFSFNTKKSFDNPLRKTLPVTRRKDEQKQEASGLQTNQNHSGCVLGGPPSECFSLHLPEARVARAARVLR